MEARKKKAILLDPYFAQLFLENDLKKNTMRSKKNKATNMETLPNKNLRETHVPYFKKKILEDEEFVQQPQATDNGRGGKTKMQYGTSEFKLKWCGAQKPHAMALMLHCYVLTFEFAKIPMRNVRKAKGKFYLQQKELKAISNV